MFALSSPTGTYDNVFLTNYSYITLNDQKNELAALKPALVAMKTTDPETSVVVRGSGDVDYQNVVGVLDALQQADITKVGLATETAP